MGDWRPTVYLRWLWKQSRYAHLFVIEEKRGWGSWKEVFSGRVEQDEPIKDSGYRVSEARFRTYVKSRQGTFENIVVDEVKDERDKTGET